MSDLDTQREEAFATADESVKELYESNVVGEKVRQIATTHNMTHQHHQALLTIAAGDFILGLVSEAELGSTIAQQLALDPASAQTTAHEVVTAIADIKQSLATDNVTPQELAEAPVADPEPAKIFPPDPALNTDIAEAEAALSAIPKMRTMAQDMQHSQQAEETIHSSSQDQLLQKNTAPDPDEIRWSSSN